MLRLRRMSLENVTSVIMLMSDDLIQLRLTTAGVSSFVTSCFVCRLQDCFLVSRVFMGNSCNFSAKSSSSTPSLMLCPQSDNIERGDNSLVEDHVGYFLTRSILRIRGRCQKQ